MESQNTNKILYKNVSDKSKLNIDYANTYEKINNIRIQSYGIDWSKLTWAYQNL